MSNTEQLKASIVNLTELKDIQVDRIKLLEEKIEMMKVKHKDEICNFNVREAKLIVELTAYGHYDIHHKKDADEFLSNHPGGKKLII